MDACGCERLYIVVTIWSCMNDGGGLPLLAPAGGNKVVTIMKITNTMGLSRCCRKKVKQKPIDL